MQSLFPEEEILGLYVKFFTLYRKDNLKNHSFVPYPEFFFNHPLLPMSNQGGTSPWCSAAVLACNKALFIQLCGGLGPPELAGITYHFDFR